jgi:hypothetical protein
MPAAGAMPYRVSNASTVSRLENTRVDAIDLEVLE